MKRSIALLLAWIMIFTAAAPVYAAEEGGDAPQPQQIVEEGGVDAEQTEPPAAPEGAPAQEPAPVETAEPVAEGEPSDAPASEPPQQPQEPAVETAVPESVETPAPSDQVPPDQTAEPTTVPEEPTPEPTAEATAEPEEPEQEEEPEPGEEQFLLISDIPEAVGQVDVSVTKALDLGEWTPGFTAALTGAAFSAERSVSADGVPARFYEVPEGDYTLTVTGQGFARYTQDIHVGRSDGVLLKLTVGRLAGYDGAAHPGLLQLGDVDGNGTVDGADAAAMMEAVDRQLPAEGAALGFTDLNRDGITNLADAEYLAKGLDIGRLDAAARMATEGRYIPAAAVAIGAAEGTSASGKENLFEDNGQVFTLGRTDGHEITPEQPVSMSFTMADGAETDAILFDDTNILSGYIDITFEDGTTAKAMIGAVPEIREPSEGEQTPESIAAPITEDVPATVDAQQPEAAPESAPAADQAPETPEEPAAPVDAGAASEVFEVPAVPMAALPEASVVVTTDGAGNITVSLGGKRP